MIFGKVLAAVLAATVQGVASPGPSPAAGSSDAPAEANPAAALLQSQVGSWNCTISEPGIRETQKLVIVWAPYGSNWIRGNVDVAAFGRRPPHKADFTFGYDPVAKAWVNVYTDSLGEYAVSKSASPPTATKLTFIDAYPLDPNDQPSVLTFGGRTTTIDSSWTEAGRRHTSREVCTKRA